MKMNTNKVNTTREIVLDFQLLHRHHHNKKTYSHEIKPEEEEEAAPSQDD